jgi:hypothetical protein
MRPVIDKHFRQWLRAAKSARHVEGVGLLLETCPSSPVPPKDEAARLTKPCGSAIATPAAE